MSYAPLPDERWYSTSLLLKEVNTALSTVADATLFNLIKTFSQIIDKILSQTFWPLNEIVYVSGVGTPAIRNPKGLPILGLDELAISAANTRFEGIYMEDYGVPSWATSYTSEVDWTPVYNYVIKGRHVYLPQDYFYNGYGNFMLTGTFGWLENSRGKLTDVTTTSTIVTGGNKIYVNNLSQFQKRDIIDVYITDDTTPVRFFVESVGTTYLNVDAYTGATTIPIGATVISWGQVPVGLELALALWIQTYLENGTSGTGAVPPGALRREKTDLYEWERFEPASGTITGEITGNVLADRLLLSYASPPFLDVL